MVNFDLGGKRNCFQDRLPGEAAQTGALIINIFLVVN
jgi:hypothetical protein